MHFKNCMCSDTLSFLWCAAIPIHSRAVYIQQPISPKSAHADPRSTAGPASYNPVSLFKQPKFSNLCGLFTQSLFDSLFSFPLLCVFLLGVTFSGTVISLIICSALWHPCGSPIKGCLLLLMRAAHPRAWWAVITTATLKLSNNFPSVSLPKTVMLHAEAKNVLKLPCLVFLWFKKASETENLCSHFF